MLARQMATMKKMRKTTTMVIYKRNDVDPDSDGGDGDDDGDDGDDVGDDGNDVDP